MGKICTKCKKEKEYEDFHKCRTSKDGFRYQCKECHYGYSVDADKRKAWNTSYYVRNKTTHPETFIWRQAKHRAKWDYNSMEFSIEVDDIKIPEVCPYLKIPLTFFGEKAQAPSLDRIDNSKGYTKDNIRIISQKANQMKSNATIEELIAFAKGVLEVHMKEDTLGDS